MKAAVRCWSLLALSVLAAPIAAQQAAKEAPVVPPRQGKREVIELFNGKDLKGWIGHEKYWSVEGDEIVGKNTEAVPVSTYLLTDRSYSDFRLVFDFKLAKSEMHSGIAMWGRLAPEQKDPYTYAGHLVMFPSGYGFYDLYGRKGIHANVAVAKPVGKQHDWNHMEILAQGNRIRFVLNGTLVSDWREPEPERIKEAPIGLQLHSNKVPQEVQFKDLVLETFPEDKLTTVAAMTKTGTGTLVLTGNNTYQGGSVIIGNGGGNVVVGSNVVISGGTLVVSSAAAKEDEDDGRLKPSDKLEVAVCPDCTAKKFRVYFGTYTKTGKSQGIYHSDLDMETGKLSEPVLAVETQSPSFLCIHPSKKFVYAVGEYGAAGGKPAGGVSAFAVDEKTGNLKHLNSQSSGGAGPCHVTIDSAGKNVLVANYGGGSCGVLPIKDDGSLAPMSGFQQHAGTSYDPKRQGTPKGHSINLDGANRFAFCCDLALDKVFIYKFDGEKGTITPNDPAYGETAKRAGPRHFAFHPAGKFAYAIGEIDCTITGFAYDSEKGSLTPIQSISTLPEGVAVEPRFSTAEVVCHPSGKFVYGSNRTQDSIVAFKVEPTTGKLTLIGHQSEGVKTPRNFNIDPQGKYALVANQAGGDVIVFAINQETGALEKKVSSVQIDSPVCVKFIALPE